MTASVMALSPAEAEVYEILVGQWSLMSGGSFILASVAPGETCFDIAVRQTLRRMMRDDWLRFSGKQDSDGNRCWELNPERREELLQRYQAYLLEQDGG